MTTSITTTRDLIRFRKFDSPIISTLVTYYLSLLSSPSPSSVLLRAAFFPAILNSTIRPRNSELLKEVDNKILNFFNSNPINVVIVQGSITNEMIKNSWNKEAGGSKEMENKIFLSHALHSELQVAKDDEEKEILANLSVMVLATLTYELAEWLFVKTHGYTPSLNSTTSRNNSIDTNSSTTTSSSSSGASLHSSYQDGPNNNSRGGSGGISVGTLAVHSCFGFDYSLLAFTIGERQLVKRLPPPSSQRRKSPSLTPPLIYSLIGDTPSILDVTSYPQINLRSTVPWKNENELDMFTVVSILEPCGQWHGDCRVGDEGSDSVSVVSLAF